jgi:hypothetical protein
MHLLFPSPSWPLVSGQEGEAQQLHTMRLGKPSRDGERNFLRLRREVARVSEYVEEVD